MMKNRYFIITMMILNIISVVRASQNNSIEISCPTWGSWPQSVTQSLLFVNDSSDSEGLSLFVVEGTGVTEVPFPVDSDTSQYSLSPNGTYLAYFESAPLNPTTSTNLTVLNTYDMTTLRFPIEAPYTAEFEILWVDEINIAIVPFRTVSPSSQFLILNMDTGVAEARTVSLPSDVETPLFVRYAPNLEFLTYISSHSMGVASASQEVLFSTLSYDDNTSAASITWRADSQEALFYTNHWLLFSPETRESFSLDLPSNYVFSSPSWSPNGTLIALVGIRWPPFDRPNIIDELFVYDRVEDNLVDICQMGNIGQYGGIRWSGDSRYLAYIIHDITLDGLNLYVLDMEINKVIAHTGFQLWEETPHLLGWRQ